MQTLDAIVGMERIKSPPGQNPGMTTGTATSDKGIGIGLAFGILTLIAAIYTLAAPTQFQTAIGFGSAVTLAVLCIAALHIYGN